MGLAEDAQEPLQQVAVDSAGSINRRRPSRRSFEQEYKYNGNSNMKVSTQEAAPEDAFVHIFGYLRYSELNTCARVSRDWRRVVYDASLWMELDLSNVWYRVNDELLMNLLKSERFEEINILNLENCRGLTDKSLIFIQSHCHTLKHLLLTNCSRLSSGACFEVARTLNLDTLELYGVTRSEWKWGVAIQDLGKGTTMPHFWKRVCAARALDEITGQPVGLDRCRHGVQFNDRACWGVMKGRNVFESNTGYPLHGNFPTEILYSCQTHEEDDYKDNELFKCEVCQLLFRESMAGDNVCCRVCFDAETLRDKENWIPLNKKKIQEFGFGDIFHKTLRLMDLRSLPDSLQSYGTAKIVASHRFDRDRHRTDQVPIDVFCTVNRTLINNHISNLRIHLSTAFEEGKTRAVLVYNQNEEIEVLADSHPIVHGMAGYRHLQLTQVAWHNGLRIITPFAICCILLGGFLWFMNPAISTNGATSALSAQLASQQQETLTPQYILIMAAVFVFALLVALCLFIRCRQQCIWFLKVFIFFDLLFLFVLGVGMLLVFTVSLIALPLDLLTYGLLTWNFAGAGMFALYNDVPASMHRFFMASLFTVMGAMMIFTLDYYIILFFAFLFALGDRISAIRPQCQILVPFMLPPTAPNPQFRNPRLFYPVDGGILRSIDLLWYGLGLKLVSASPDMITMTAGAVSMMYALVRAVFIGPYFGSSADLRPVPIAFVLVILLRVMGDTVLRPCVAGQLVWSTTTTSFGNPPVVLY